MYQYVMSDIHGRYETFMDALEDIQEISERANKGYKIYVLGDVVSRGKDGIRLLQYIMANRESIEMIMGNHELMLRDCLTDKESMQIIRECTVEEIENMWETNQGITKTLRMWISHGGLSTIAELKERSTSELEDIEQFIGGLQYHKAVYCGGKQYYLVHGRAEGYIGNMEAGDIEELKYFLNSPEAMLWGNTRSGHIVDGAKIVFGHITTCMYDGSSTCSILKMPNSIGIDCGCSRMEQCDGYRLGCLRLNDMEELYYRNTKDT